MVEMDASNQNNNTNKPESAAPAVSNSDAVPYETAVAHEFVRQYYTIMHKSPELLYRFYCHDSSLVHGDLEGTSEPQKIGVEAIEKRFSTLQPGEISAKIRCLDSMGTVNNSIVVQVSGTLWTKDNRRPFVQTFVLVGQAANKYYVRNDIFRYQDLLLGQNGPISPQPQDVVEQVNSEEENMPEPVEKSESESSEQAYELFKANNSASKDESASVSYDEQMESEINVPESVPEVVENGHDEEPKPEVKETVENGPKSYASMLSKPWSHIANSEPVSQKVETNTFVDASGDNAKTAFVVETKPEAVPQKPAKKPNNNGINFNNNNSITNNNNNIRKFESKTEGENGDDMTSPGECQLFVGNLLPTTGAEELKAVFSQYGKIVDIRLNRGNVNKPGVKNYGFISFESPEVVDMIVSKKPIFHDGHRFNVERKDPSARGPTGRKFDQNRQFNNPQRGGNAPSHPPRNGNVNMQNNYRSNQGNNATGQGYVPGSMHRPRNMNYQSNNNNNNIGNNNNTNRNFNTGKNRV